MARHDLLHSDARPDDADAAPGIDVLIRSGLRRAFPLPEEDAADGGFRLLLDALARRHPAPFGTVPSGLAAR